MGLFCYDFGYCGGRVVGDNLALFDEYFFPHGGVVARDWSYRDTAAVFLHWYVGYHYFRFSPRCAVVDWLLFIRLVVVGAIHEGGVPCFGEWSFFSADIVNFF